jgi:hypothetical protein
MNSMPEAELTGSVARDVETVRIAPGTFIAIRRGEHDQYS